MSKNDNESTDNQPPVEREVDYSLEQRLHGSGV